MSAHEKPRDVTLPTAADFPFEWQRFAVCDVYPDLEHVLGSYGVRLNTDADEDEQGGHMAWEVWHWPSCSVESDWYVFSDAIRECRRLYAAERWPVSSAR